MTTRKLGQLCGVNIVRIVEPVGVRVRCEFVSIKHPSVEFEIAGDLALGIAKELEMLLPSSGRKKAAAPRGQRAPTRRTWKPRAAAAKSMTR